MAKEPVEQAGTDRSEELCQRQYSCSAWSRRRARGQARADEGHEPAEEYLETYTTQINSVEPDQIEAAAKKYMATDNDTIVVVGDAAKIQKPLEKIGNVRSGETNAQ